MAYGDGVDGAETGDLRAGNADQARTTAHSNEHTVTNPVVDGVLVDVQDHRCTLDADGFNAGLVGAAHALTRYFTISCSQGWMHFSLSPPARSAMRMFAMYSVNSCGDRAVP